MAQIFPLCLVKKKEDVDKTAEMDIKWEEDSLINTVWHFQGRDEVEATISMKRG